jgi:hypothetical protein
MYNQQLAFRNGTIPLVQLMAASQRWLSKPFIMPPPNHNTVASLPRLCSQPIMLPLNRNMVASLLRLCNRTLIPRPNRNMANRHSHRHRSLASKQRLQKPEY